MVGAVSAWAQQGKGVTTAIVIGTSPIHGEDMSASRQKAINASLETAVSQALLNTIPEERLAANFQVIGDTIFKQTDQFIQGYKVLTESNSGKTYRVLVQATISMDHLTSELAKAGIAWGQKTELRVLICLAEKKVTDLDYQYWWGDMGQGELTIAPETVTQQLVAGGIEVVALNTNTLGAIGYPVELSLDQALELGRQANANVVVIGRATAEEAPNTMGSALRSFRGSLEMRAYFIEDGEPVVHITQDKLVASNDYYQGGKDALNAVALQAGETLAQKLEEAWLGQGAGTASLELVVEGTGGHISNFVQFRGVLGTMSGVESMQLEQMMPDSAIMSVVYQGNARALAEALLLKSFDTFGINIVETGNRYIRLQLIPH
jgi:hypothetical protein